MANDFSGDANCVALWRFESGALITDSQGGNTLTDNNTVGTEAVDFKEGAACADFEHGNSEYLSIAEADTDADFPLREDDSNLKISVCFWIKAESFTSSFPAIFSRYTAAAGYRVFQVSVNDSDKVYIAIGYNNGDSFENTSAFGTAISTAKWYHVGVTYEDSSKAYKIRVWDDDASNLLDINTTGNTTNNIDVTATNTPGYGVGARSAGTQEWDGFIDEMVIFKDILSDTEIDEIRAGTYGAGAPTSILPLVANRMGSGCNMMQN